LLLQGKIVKYLVGKLLTRFLVAQLRLLLLISAQQSGCNFGSLALDH